LHFVADVDTCYFELEQLYVLIQDVFVLAVVFFPV